MKQVTASPRTPHTPGLRKSPVAHFRRQVSGTGSDRLWIDPYTQERVWVFNPMHIVHLTTQTKSRFLRVVEGFKAFSNKWFSHVLLLMFLILYGFLGAYIFMTIEAPIENTVKVRGVVVQHFGGAKLFDVRNRVR